MQNGSPFQQHLLKIDNEHAVEIARFLRNDPELRLDFIYANVTGIDWLDRTIKKTVKVKQVVDGVEKQVDQTAEVIPGYQEAVTHLYSIARRHGPVIIRMRAADHAAETRLPSLTPVSSAEFQGAENLDLYGIYSTAIPISDGFSVWDEFEDYPMRKDYREPDDYEYEPTPHDDAGEGETALRAAAAARWREKYR